MPDMPYLHLKAQSENGILILTITEPRVQGDDIADSLRQEMLTAQAEAGVQKVVVDCQHTQYLSSTAFRPFLALRRKLLDPDTDLKVAWPLYQSFTARQPPPPETEQAVDLMWQYLIDLRARQKPLKERYRQEADSAKITLRARGSQTDTPIACSLDIGRAIYAAQAHSGVGGAGTVFAE